VAKRHDVLYDLSTKEQVNGRWSFLNLQKHDDMIEIVKKLPAKATVPLRSTI
jgi:hypothetical protein